MKILNDNFKIPQLLSVAYYKAPRRDDIKPHLIPAKTQYIELVVAGKTRFEFGGKELEFGCGSMFWHTEGDWTIHKNDPKNPYECLCLRFRGNNTSQQRSHPRISIWRNKEDAINFSELILDAFHDHSIPTHFVGLYAYIKILWESRVFSVLKPELRIPESMLKLEKYISANFAENISIETLARISEISIPHLYLLTRKHFKQTPHDLILEKRFQEAKRLLLTTREPIKEISSRCGFINLETFYRAFKRRFKIPPGEMRKISTPYLFPK